MARKVTPAEFLGKIAFIKHLPDEGGSWGRGIIMTLEDQAKEIRRLEVQREFIGSQIRDRLQLMRGSAKRAEREAELVGYSKTQIEEAQVEVEVTEAEKITASDLADADAGDSTEEG